MITTQEIAQTLAAKLHFNTFGGNPVCCAGGRAVLQALDEDRCQANSAEACTPCCFNVLNEVCTAVLNEVCTAVSCR